MNSISKKTLLQPKKILFALGFLIFWISAVTSATSSSSVKVPTEYFANYQIQKDRNRLQELFVDIDADSRIGKIWWTTIYNELNAIMTRIFPYFPQDYNFQVVYKQCLKTTREMQWNTNRENYNSFIENCKNPLSNVNATIQNKYTVKATASTNPSSGPAPLTVTFDARGSSDPSNETIPSRNYFWYYRDIDGIDKPIWYWPVVNYRFNESGIYLVHLTVRSSNAGIFDWETTVSVNVSPKSANVIVYANGKKMDKNKYVKVGIQEAKKGIVFDGSATLPMWGREIMSHRWEITSRDGFSWAREWDWKPGYINLPLPSQWEFNVSLTVNDNESNTVSERYSLSVSDPVASIQQTPDKGMTSTTYSFSAAASYSLTSRIKLFTWEIYDSEGVKLDTLQGKEIKKQFKKPGNYTVKLTVEDEIGNKNLDTVNVYVESTPPVPQFTITPTSLREYPSEFTFNADSSSDVDVGNGYDKLTYDWQFSNPNAVHITKTEKENKLITVLFNEVWTHKVTLVVSDKFGKISEIEKAVEVKSTLRPVLKIRPRAAVWKTYVTFAAQANHQVLSYERDFWDWTVPRVNQTNVMKHEYQRVGTYRITLKATDEQGNSNTVYDTVYIGEKDSPIISYDINNDYGIKVAQNDKCTDEKGNEHSAFRIDRQSRFNIDTSSSVNAQWNATNLRTYFQVQNDEIININNHTFSHKFNSLWCQYIDYILEDTSLGKNVKERIWFKVVNALPRLDNLMISFPQYGNEIGIWFQQWNKTQDIFNSGIDPIIVKVTAENPMDPDGAISYFKWYYYPKDNPNKIIETRITQGSIPYTFFAVPKIPWEYVFWVKMFDNDDGNQTSEEIIGNWPLIMFPPDGKQPDIPIVTLRSDKINAEVWDEITFDIISKVLSDRSDFVKDRTIQLDFDGDGVIDMTTKNDRVKRVYNKPSPKDRPYKPVAYVTYRDHKGMWEWAQIVVKNWIKPALIYATMGTTVLFKDVSIGNLISREICWDTRECEKWNKKYLDTTLDKKTFKVQYSKPGTYPVTIKAKDSNANEATAQLEVKVDSGSDFTSLTTGLQIISLPNIEKSDKGHLEIFVGRQLNNEVVFYLKTASRNDQCWVDTNILIDTNLDGTPDNDRDLSCNKILTQSYIPKSESIIWRIVYQAEGSAQLFKKDFTVTFADYENGLSPELQAQYSALSELIANIDDRSSIANADLRNLLISLRNDLGDINKTRSSVIQIEDFLKKNTTKLTKKQQEKLDDILIALSDHATLSAKGVGVYEVAKSEILALLPLSLKKESSQIFDEFERAESLVESGSDTRSIRAEKLIKLYTFLQKNAVDPNNIWENQIWTDDFKNVIEKNICENIAKQYELSTIEVCHDVNKKSWETKTIPPVETTKTTGTSGFPSWLKVILWVLWIVVVGFIWVIAAFAIKAKLRETHDEEE